MCWDPFLAHQRVLTVPDVPVLLDPAIPGQEAVDCRFWRQAVHVEDFLEAAVDFRAAVGTVAKGASSEATLVPRPMANSNTSVNRVHC